MPETHDPDDPSDRVPKKTQRPVFLAFYIDVRNESVTDGQHGQKSFVSGGQEEGVDVVSSASRQTNRRLTHQIGRGKDAFEFLGRGEERRGDAVARSARENANGEGKRVRARV